jgi:hypothetical protein
MDSRRQVMVRPLKLQTKASHSTSTDGQTMVQHHLRLKMATPKHFSME